MSIVNYITNLQVKNFSGGWSGMNHHIYSQLALNYSINLVENINPPYFLPDKLSSKAFRMLGMKGCFPAFTNRRLNKIKSLTEVKLGKNADLNFFHGATPWLHVSNELPYALYLDGCYATYMNIYHQKELFDSRQLGQLFEKETVFLQNARAVFFSSEWALNDARKNYKLPGDNFYVAGLGGSFAKSIKAEESKSLYFLFTALNFFDKGGDKLVAAFTKLLDEFPEFKLKIIGERPPGAFLKNNQVEYVGFLDKSIPADHEKLVEIFSNAYCFVLPTAKDLTPLVLIEAASVGCPVISINRFGIPELVKNNETGILLNPSENIEEQLLQNMRMICADSALRKKMGEAAYTYIHDNFSWDRTGQIIIDKLKLSKN